MSEQQQELEIGTFKPYVPVAQRRVYTPEEDQHILEALGIAEREEIPFEAVFNKLSDEMDRSPKAIEVRYYILKKRLRGEDADDSEEDSEEDDTGAILSRIRAVFKGYNNYKSKYDALKADYDKLQADHDKVSKEMNKIRRLLSGD